MESSNRSLVESSQPALTTEHYVIIFLNTWILGPQIIFGCSGNILNLLVLLHRTMRSRTNLIFAAMAMSDLAFLLLHLPILLFYAGPLMESYFLRGHQNVLIAHINWCSASSIWLMTYATLERVQVIRSPFRASDRKAVSTQFFLSVGVIWLIAFILTVVPTNAHYIHGGQSLQEHRFFKAFLVNVNAALIIVGPLLVCIILNWRLVTALKENNRDCWNTLDDQHNHALIESRVKTERRVTIVVCVILSCFVVFNVPGAVLYCYREIYHRNSRGMSFILAQTISNTLTITGKVLNFVLFCLTSEHFRKLLRERCAKCSSITRRHSNRSQRTTTIAMETF